VRRCDKQVLDEVALLGIGADYSAPASSLFAIRINRHPLDVAAVAHRDYHLFFGDKVLGLEYFRRPSYRGPPLIAILLPYFVNVLRMISIKTLSLANIAS